MPNDPRRTTPRPKLPKLPPDIEALFPHGIIEIENPRRSLNEMFDVIDEDEEEFEDEEESPVESSSPAEHPETGEGWSHRLEPGTLWQQIHRMRGSGESTD